MKLTYWYAQRKNDSDCYSIIAKTKKEAQAKVDHIGAECFEPVEKRTIDYADGFDLFEMVTSEGGGRGYGYSD